VPLIAFVGKWVSVRERLQYLLSDPLAPWIPPGSLLGVSWESRCCPWVFLYVLWVLLGRCFLCFLRCFQRPLGFSWIPLALGGGRSPPLGKSIFCCRIDSIPCMVAGRWCAWGGITLLEHLGMGHVPNAKLFRIQRYVLVQTPLF